MAAYTLPVAIARRGGGRTNPIPPAAYISATYAIASARSETPRSSASVSKRDAAVATSEESGSAVPVSKRDAADATVEERGSVVPVSKRDAAGATVQDAAGATVWESGIA
jgi:hypothetical protein